MPKTRRCELTKQFDSLFPIRTAKFSNTLTGTVFLITYNLRTFKSRLNRHFLGKRLGLCYHYFPLQLKIIHPSPLPPFFFYIFFLWQYISWSLSSFKEQLYYLSLTGRLTPFAGAGSSHCRIVGGTLH